MDDAELAARLESGSEGLDATAFPDGSVDAYYAVRDAARRRIASREAFGSRLAAGAGSFSLDRGATEPGGQAPNAARQFDALGDDVVLAGHLDHPVFDELDLPAVSMGEPSDVSVYDFEDGDVMLSADSPDLGEWTLSDLRDALGDSFEARLGADAVFCGNWISSPRMTDALVDLAERGIDGGVFALDPGDLTDARAGPIRRLGDALGALDGDFEAVLSATGDELAHAAAALGVAGEEVDVDGATAALREEFGVTAVVRHDTAEAAAATRAGRFASPNYEVDGVGRQTGAGDRFTAGLAHGLAAGWGWEEALALGNACASYRVGTGGTGTRGELAAFVRER